MPGLTDRDRTTIARIVRVNHAGETGAIRIYAAQLWRARRRYPDMAPALEKMRRDEIRHCAIFREAMTKRDTRPCRVMALWSLGGFVIGFATALLGRNMIWVCTEAVETTVHKHLIEQLHFLKDRDPALFAKIDAIKEEELEHRDHAIEMQKGRGLLDRIAYAVISALTGLMIWLSTWGDPSLMVRDLRADQA
ncbi:MAG: ubiquinone biosynthesis family protein [Rhizobium sp.]|nr:ubiquinone biosynthesis family protein [Rhizobium sp.]